MQVDTTTMMDDTEMSTTTPADVAVDTTQVDAPATPEGKDTPAAEANAANPVDAAATPAAPAYTPDFKVKIKGKDHEIDEMFRGLIKDAESEKKVKEIFEKAYGIEAVKQDRTAIKTEYEGFKSQVIPYLQTYDQFTTLRDQGNLGAAFKVANISDEAVFEYCLQCLEMEKNPHLAKTYSAQQEQSLKELELQRKVAMYEQQNQQTEEQQFYQELQTAMDAHADLVGRVNSKFGTESFFMDEVVAYGLAQLQRGKHLSPAEATEFVVNKYKQFFPATPAQPAQATAPATPQAPHHQRPATMPNTGNSSVSPVAQKVRSLDDLSRLAAEAQRAG